MMGTIFVFLLSAVLVSITVAGERKPEQQRLWMFVNLGLSALGLIGLPLTHLLTKYRIQTVGAEASFISWANDMLHVYDRLSLPLLGFLLLLLVAGSLPPLFDARQLTGLFPKIRVCASCASSVLLLFSALFYGMTVQHSTVNLYPCVLLLGLWESLLLRLPLALEYAARIRAKRRQTMKKM